MAREPEMMHKSYEYLSDIPTIIHINEMPVFDRPDFDLTDESVFTKKFIPAIEKSVRGSFEYKQMVSYLREYVDMNKCAFYDKFNNLETTRIHIEIHHEPFSLYDICQIVYNKRVSYGESIEVEMIAKEVMFLHYQLQVGLIPLAETVHELVHNQYLFVPSSKVYGKYKEFQSRYDPWIPPELKQILDDIEEKTRICDEEEYKSILARNYIYVNNSDNRLPTMEEVGLLIKGRVNDILNKRD